MKLSVIVSFLIISSLESAVAQSAYVKMGQQALMDGDFRSAISHLEKACITDSTNANALWMLGYSYYHSDNYKKSITAYTRVIAIKPADASAYYYRARAKSFLGKDNQTSPADKELYLLGAIVDLTKAISINSDPNDSKFYQNRGLAYRDYGLFKLQNSSHFYDRARGINSLKACITDLERVLNDNPGRTDIANLIDQSKDKLSQAIAPTVARH
ncbi:Tetratricopeptide repeat-containing protein [Mucilaginibacter lappiensis]|uniref:Tetratricopeptide (TPR) repeat protein n=1 Tax=Mucilaginibacter lappiensis TaxID=354630 RepID=A0ABR6PLK9_9SPHI|nr:tetratricopeptide repeat protein [Mucilaginibacter lappiensis]MBB6110663.1 tetratricopeptide (TPR) repeat protein [Mucilaginibacter lappiensis]SIR44767.1 Tetratricopeptide repeat-containing protein [Mucilaginibacter lappiensis]